MLSSPSRPLRRLPWLLLPLGLAAVAWAGPRGTSHDLPALVAAASSDALVVPDHPKVQEALARLEGPKGSAFVRAALERRGEQSPAIRRALAKAGLPLQLEAVAFIESGYNVSLTTGEGSKAPGQLGAGLWMFIPSTAREYGLQVDDKLDERLDPTLETEAAIALLTDMHDEFGSWGLALAAYNQGPAHVRKAIDTQGSRDAMVLSEAGALNHYVATVYAGMALLAEAD